LIGIATFGKVGENTLEKAKEYLKNKEGKWFRFLKKTKTN
jgi:hypothetical protein